MPAVPAVKWVLFRRYSARLQHRLSLEPVQSTIKYLIAHCTNNCVRWFCDCANIFPFQNTRQHSNPCSLGKDRADSVGGTGSRVHFVPPRFSGFAVRVLHCSGHLLHGWKAYVFAQSQQKLDVQKLENRVIGVNGLVHRHAQTRLPCTLPI